MENYIDNFFTDNTQNVVSILPLVMIIYAVTKSVFQLKDDNASGWIARTLSF